MNWTKDSTNSALRDAAKAGDVKSTRELLDQGADSNCLIDHEPPFEFTKNTAQVSVEILKLLVQYGATVDRKLMREIFKPPFCYYAEETVTQILHYHKDKKTLHIVFEQLAQSKEFKELKIMELLIENGLPINGLFYYDKNVFPGSITPLHLCILQSKIDYVLLLLKHDADVNKKSSGGSNALCLAVICHDVRMVELLLKNDANINEVSQLSRLTPLCMACQQKDVDIVKILLDCNAKINYLDKNQTTPLELATGEVRELLIKELIMQEVEGHCISTRNLECLKANQVEKYFSDRVDELKRMKNCCFYLNVSFYDFIKLKMFRKLAILAKPADFITAFETARARHSFEYYGSELDNIFESAKKKRDNLRLEEKKLYSIFKNHLPEVVINRIAYFSFE